MLPEDNSGVDKKQVKGNGGAVKEPKLFELTSDQKARHPTLVSFTVDQILELAAKSAPRVESAPTASDASIAKSAPPVLFPARIKLDCKEGGQTYDGGHEIMKINSGWQYVDLRANIKNKFTKLQKADSAKRINIGPRSLWSDIHDVDEIKTHCVPNAVDSWVPVDEQGLTCMTEENCPDVLDLVKNMVAPTLFVVIVPRQK